MQSNANGRQSRVTNFCSSAHNSPASMKHNKKRKVNHEIGYNMRSINFLNSTAGGCSSENTFKSDVQSVLLSIIHELLVKRKFELLVPTVHVWSIDVVDVVIFELGDKKVTKNARSFISPAEYC